MKLNSKTILTILDSIYDNALIGLPKTPSVQDLCQEYEVKFKSHEERLNRLIRRHVMQNYTNGFVNGVGGAITLPVTLPLELTAAFYIQMRMITAIAHMNGYNILSDEVRILTYFALLGETREEEIELKRQEVQKKLKSTLVKSFSKELLFSLQSFIGPRIVKKISKKGAFHFGRWVPLIGGVVGGGVEGYFCYKAGVSAKKIFVFKNSKRLTESADKS